MQTGWKRRRRGNFGTRMIPGQIPLCQSGAVGHLQSGSAKKPFRDGYVFRSFLHLSTAASRRFNRLRQQCGRGMYHQQSTASQNATHRNLLNNASLTYDLYLKGGRLTVARIRYTKGSRDANSHVRVETVLPSIQLAAKRAGQLHP